MKPMRGNRTFLVGCPRSGTTLLQSMLAAHPQVASFPETHFFPTIVDLVEFREFGEVPRKPRRRRRLLRTRLLRRLGIASQWGIVRLKNFLSEIGRADLDPLTSRCGVTMRSCTAALLDVLDTIALEQGKAHWVEKTPDNLHYVDIMERYVPKARFVHLVRNGRDNVASIHHAAQEYPEPWGREYPTLDRCIRRWLRCAGETLKHSRKKNHFVVRYERLADAPRAALERVCDFIGVDFDDSMLEDYGEAANGVILDRETWKADVSGPIRNANGTKFYQIFDERQRQEVLERTAEVDLSGLGP